MSSMACWRELSANEFVTTWICPSVKTALVLLSTKAADVPNAKSRGDFVTDGTRVRSAPVPTIAAHAMSPRRSGDRVVCPSFRVTVLVSEVSPILICPDFLPAIEAKQLVVDFGRSRCHGRDYSELRYSSEPDC
jgi:hypothetical protein